MLMVLFTCVFEDVSPEDGWVLRTTATGVSKIVNNLIEQTSQRSPRAPRPAPSATSKASSPPSKTSSAPLSAHRRRRNATPSLAPRRVRASDGRARGVRGRARGGLLGERLTGARADHRPVPAAAVRCGLRDAEAGVQGGEHRARGDAARRPQFAGLLRTVAGAPGEQTVIEQGSGKEKVVVQTGDLIFASFKHTGMNVCFL